LTPDWIGPNHDGDAEKARDHGEEEDSSELQYVGG
jgi:hypothetical protein